MADKNPHLSELFQTGQLEVFDFEGAGQVEIWMEKPGTIQQDDCMTKAKAKRSRVIMAHKDKKSDDYLALESEMLIADDEEFIEALLAVKRDELNRQAINEVLHNEDYGSDWGENGQDYIDLLDAVQSRTDEITAHNDSLDEEDIHLAIILGDDEEIKRLLEVEKQFADEVQERRDVLLETENQRLRRLTSTKLREDYRDMRIGLESELVWFQEYKMWLLYYACRDPEKREKLYFTNIDQLRQLPGHVQQQLLTRYDAFDQGGEFTKKLLSRLSSSDLSESSKELAATSQPSGPKE